MTQKNKMIVTVVAIIAMLAAIFFFGVKKFNQHTQDKAGSVISTNSQVLVPDYAVRKGSPSAAVTVVEFLDPECESCRRFNPYLHSIMNDYDGKIQLVVRYAAFHANSSFAIKILEAARKQDKYWQALEILFQHQPEWGDHHNPRPELIWTFLPRMNIDVEKLKRDMEDPKIVEIIEQDAKDGQALGVKATPTFFVNGKMVQEFGPHHLRAAIDEALK